MSGRMSAATTALTGTRSMNDEIATLIDKAARLAGQRVAGGGLGELASLPDGLAAAALFVEAWRTAGLEGEPARLRGPTPANLPLAGWRADLGWILVQGRSADTRWRAERLDELFRITSLVYDNRRHVGLLRQAAEQTEALGRLWEAWGWQRMILAIEPTNESAWQQSTKLRTRLDAEHPERVLPTPTAVPRTTAETPVACEPSDVPEPAPGLVESSPPPVRQTRPGRRLRQRPTAIRPPHGRRV